MFDNLALVESENPERGTFSTQPVRQILLRNPHSVNLAKTSDLMKDRYYRQ
jgi:hypothetical protein